MSVSLRDFDEEKANAICDEMTAVLLRRRYVDAIVAVHSVLTSLILKASADYENACSNIDFLAEDAKELLRRAMAN